MNSPRQETEDTRFAVATIAAAARQMPCRDAVRLLHGLLLIGGDHDAMEPVRNLYISLHSCEQQLDLLSKPQPRPSAGHDGDPR